MKEPLTIFITGGAGYVGAMLADQFSARDDVKELILLDKEPMPEFLQNHPKITYIQQNMSDDGWQQKVMPKKPNVVIHTAWEIREKYGDRKTQWKWNVEGSNKVFDFVFSFSSVKKFIHFSTVASYGAYKSNDADYRFTEKDPFRKSDYLYAEEKRVVEENLAKKYQEALRQAQGKPMPQVFILRPAAITGPRGRFMRVRFGIQSALSGQLKGSKSIAYRVISSMVGFVPATREWVRQFIHEDDVNDIVSKIAFENLPGEPAPPAGRFEIFNICPPGDIVRAKDMAKAVGKHTLTVTPQMVRFAYFFAWHLSRGKIPTARGSWKSYSYPIAVDGSKITRQYDYQYQHNSLDAFTKKEGRYAKYIK